MSYMPTMGSKTKCGGEAIEGELRFLFGTAGEQREVEVLVEVLEEAGPGDPVLAQDQARGTVAPWKMA